MQVSLSEEGFGLDDAVAIDSGVESSDAVAPSLITLRRSGKRSLNFRGEVVANAMSFRPGTPLWYEVNVFQVASGGYVGDVRMFTKAEGELDRFTVTVAGSLEEIADFFESYEPANDIEVDLAGEAAEVPLADLAFKALALRARVETARAQFQSVVSEVFDALTEHMNGGRPH